MFSKESLIQRAKSWERKYIHTFIRYIWRLSVTYNVYPLHIHVYPLHIHVYPLHMTFIRYIYTFIHYIWRLSVTYTRLSVTYNVYPLHIHVYPLHIHVYPLHITFIRYIYTFIRYASRGRNGSHHVYMYASAYISHRQTASDCACTSIHVYVCQHLFVKLFAFKLAG
jgi:hypothetical protein